MRRREAFLLKRPARKMVEMSGSEMSSSEMSGLELSGSAGLRVNSTNGTHPYFFGG